MRSSIGFMPTVSATLSMWASMAKSTPVMPKPRIAVAGVRLV
jgi:hypothetical protein